MSIVGRTYRWKGERVEIVAQWKGKGPRNVLVCVLRTGKLVVRPFRGLRKETAL